jgi:hypothetical protein
MGPILIVLPALLRYRDQAVSRLSRGSQSQRSNRAQRRDAFSIHGLRQDRITTTTRWN